MFENIKLEFGNKSVKVLFDNAKKWHAVKNPVESTSWANALTHLMNKNRPAYRLMERGLYLHQASFEAAFEADPFDNRNDGYCTGERLVGLIGQELVSCREAVNPIGIYRIGHKRTVFYAVEIVAQKYEKGEYENVAHDRKAFYLIKAFEDLRTAEELGFNITLLYTEKEVPFFETKEAQWELYRAGQFDELAEMVRAGTQEAAANNTLNHYAELSAKAVAKNTPFPLPVEYKVKTYDGGELLPEDLIGSEIRFCQGQIVMNRSYVVSEDNLGSIVATLKKAGLRVFIADAK
jgi:hypothetical protein